MSAHGSDAAIAMDPDLWGELYAFIDLATLVFAKLPLPAFFRLRQVCKAWNALAADPTFLRTAFTAPIPRPYFVVDSHRAGHRLLSYDGAWTWTRLPRVKCESSGLLIEDSDSNRVFDVHTRMVYALPDITTVRVPPLPVEEEEDYEEPLVGMIVDTSVKPYGFRVILGDELIGTRIYDSRSGSWTQKESTHEDSAIGNGARPGPVCAFSDGVLYIRVWRMGGYGTFDLHCYDVRRDEWDFELLPGIDEEEEEEWVFCDIGMWKDRLFMFGMRFEPPCSIVAWELWKSPDGFYSPPDDVYDGTWKRFACMPVELCSWMLAGEEEKLKRGWAHEFVDIKSRFCGEYVLLYNSGGRADFTEERAVMFNLDSMTWEKVELPGSVV